MTAMTDAYYPEAVRELMEYFRRLPGVGRRGAERLVTTVLEWPSEESFAFGKTLSELHSRIGRCPGCGAWAEEGALCRICVVREGSGIPLQYSCLENPMDRGAWWAAVHEVAKSWTRLSNFTFSLR